MTMDKKTVRLLLLVAVAIGAASCSSKTYKNINYFQDIQADTTWAMKVNKGILIQPQDKISIIVSTRDPELAAMFNLTYARYTTGSESTGVNGAGGGNMLGYVVDSNGEINFPVLGAVYVAGMTRWELSNHIRQELIDRELLRDPVVTVEFMNFKVSVMGEVKTPGTYTIVGDKVTILQALSLAGDLTIYGKRENVTVVREQGKKRSAYQIDLRNTEDLFGSPAYFLQQNDVIYVYPNKVRAGQSTINENSMRSVNFWTSAASFVVSLANSALILATRIENSSNKD